MKSVVSQSMPLSPAWLRRLIIFVLVVGVVFRFVNLNHKVYWHDEVYTSIRAAGYTAASIEQEIFQNRIVSAQDLLRFQRIKPGSTPIDTIDSLAIEDPQHPPFYFLLDRVWVQLLGTPIQAIFGSPLTAPRLLPALISLLSLPLMYALAWELFGSASAALLATALLALSPFDVLFAQVARQYSLLTLTVIASHLALLRAMRRSTLPKPRSRDVLKHQPPTWPHWSLYALSVALGLYTHPFFGLAVVGQAVYVGLEAIANQPGAKMRQLLTSFGLSLAGALIGYAPWLWVILTGFHRVLSVTSWADDASGVGYLVKLWTLSFTALFLDLDVGFNNPWTFVFRVPILLLIGLAFYTLYRRTDRAVWSFVLIVTLVPFLMLALPDLLMDTRRSAVSRYLIPCYPGIQLAIAALLATKLTPKPRYIHRSSTLVKPTHAAFRFKPSDTLAFLKRWRWRGVLFGLITTSIISCTVSAASFTWWHNVPSYFNADIARRVNTTPGAILLSDHGDYTNLGDLISLSYRLQPQVQMLLINQDVHWVDTAAFADQIQGSPVIVFRPSGELRAALERSRGPLEPLLPQAQLWQLPGT